MNSWDFVSFCWPRSLPIWSEWRPKARKTASCAYSSFGILKNSQKKSILKSILGDDSSPNFDLNSFIGVSWTCANPKQPPKLLESVSQSKTEPRNFWIRIARFKHLHAFFFMNYCLSWCSKANQCVWFCFCAIYEKLPWMVVRVSGIQKRGFPI